LQFIAQFVSALRQPQSDILSVYKQNSLTALCL